MRLELSADELLTTTRAVRKQRRWGWLFVDDLTTGRSMAELHRQGLSDHDARDRTGEKG